MTASEPDSRKYENIYTLRPASLAQLVGMSITTALGAVLGLVAIAIAVFEGITGTRIWVMFVSCEGLAVISGIVSTKMYIQRRTLLTTALAVVMEYEDLLETAPAARRSSNDTSSDRPNQTIDALNNARRWRSYLLSSGIIDLAERFQRAILRFEIGVRNGEHESHLH